MSEHATVMVVDGGGRGHALVEAYARSPHVDRVIAVPGNDMMKNVPDALVQTVSSLTTTDVDAIVTLCQEQRVTLVDVAQDDAVAAGLADETRKLGILTVGPGRGPGRMESSKIWARQFGDRHDLPQPRYVWAVSPLRAETFLNSQPDQRWFVKTSGLAGGKGARPAQNNEQAIQQGHSLYDEFHDELLLEDWITNDDGTHGEEFSMFILSDGTSHQVIGCAQDHKRVFNYDEGENTGGMGVVSPPLLMTEEMTSLVDQRIITPALAGLAAEGRPYIGVLYLGGMMVRRGGKLEPFIVEWNSRWGDPETEGMASGIENDFFEMNMATASGDISDLKIETDGLTRVVVTGASRGYPDDYSEVKGKEIFGLDEVRKLPNVRLYGAGVRVEDGRHYAAGGRLFYIVGEGWDVVEARQHAYEAMSLVHVDGNNLHYRTDIGWRDMERLTRRTA